MKLYIIYIIRRVRTSASIPLQSHFNPTSIPLQSHFNPGSGSEVDRFDPHTVGGLQ